MAAPPSYKKQNIKSFHHDKPICAALFCHFTAILSKPSVPLPVSFALFLIEILTIISSVLRPEPMRSFYSETVKGYGASRLVVISRLTLDLVYLQD